MEISLAMLRTFSRAHQQSLSPCLLAPSHGAMSTIHRLIRDSFMSTVILMEGVGGWGVKC